MPDPNMLGPAMLGVTQSISSVGTFLPKLTDVRKADPSDTTFAADVRLGEIAMATVTLGVGIIASSLTGSPVPTWTAVLMCGILIILYEAALRGDRPFEPKAPIPTNVVEH